ncbi:MAG: dockerin type I domain-containing protein [Bacteroidales bacterium]|nr:dockerin type I domain-containing protein [Bacteroidales bacterium]
MKKILAFCLMTCFFLTGSVLSAESLSWTWEVTTTASTHTKTLTLGYVDSLFVDWGDGVQERLAPSVENSLFEHVYTTPGNYECIATATSISYFKADSRRLLLLDPSACPSLTYLSCTSSQLKSLNVSQNPLLVSLYCGSNELTALQLSANTALEALTCTDNALVSLDVSMLPSLKKLTCHTNPLEQLRVCSLGFLTYVSAASGNLSQAALDALIGELPVLKEISSSQNLNLEGNPGFETCALDLAVQKKWSPVKIQTKSLVSVLDTSVRAGQTAKMKLEVNNICPIVAFEMDLLLPKGVELDTLSTCLTPDRKGNHLLSVVKMSDTTQLYKLISYSMTEGDRFLGVSGSLIDLYVRVPDTIAVHDIDIKSVILVDTLSKSCEVSLSDGSLTVVPNVLPGDANRDGCLDITDVVWLIERINNRAPEGFDAYATDMDGNGKWNVVDVVLLIDRIHTGLYDPLLQRVELRQGAASLREYIAENAQNGNHLYFTQSEEHPDVLELCLRNPSEAYALQFDVLLPDFCSLDVHNTRLNPTRAGQHVASIRKAADGSSRYRILIYSLQSNHCLDGSDGVILRAALDSKSEQGSMEARLGSAVMTNNRLQSEAIQTYDTKLAHPTETPTSYAFDCGSEGDRCLWFQSASLADVSLMNVAGVVLQNWKADAARYSTGVLQRGTYLLKATFSDRCVSRRKVFVP